MSIEIRPSDVILGAAEALRRGAKATQYIYNSMYEADRVSQVNQQLAYIEQSYQEYNESLPKAMIDVQPEMIPYGPPRGAPSTIKKSFGQASLADIEVNEDKFFQKQLEYITKNTTNSKARKEMIQHLTMKNIQNKAIIVRQWNVAADHEAKAGLNTLYSTVLASNDPWEVKVAKISTRVDEMVVVGRLRKDEGENIKAKATAAAQYSFAHNGAMTVMKETGDPAAGEVWLKENTPFYDGNPGVRDEIMDELEARLNKQNQRAKAARIEQERLGFLRLVTDLESGEVTLEDAYDSTKYPLSESNIKHFQSLRDRERQRLKSEVEEERELEKRKAYNLKIQRFHQAFDELIENAGTWEELNTLETEIYDAGLETSDLRILTNQINAWQKALRGEEDPAMRKKREEYGRARALLNADELDKLSDKLTAKAYTSFDAKDDEYFWLKIASRRKELEEEKVRGDPMTKTDPVILAELVKMFYDEDKFSNDDIDSFISGNHGPDTEGNPRLSNADVKTWSDKLMKRQVYATQKLAAGMITQYFDDIAQYETDPETLLEFRKQEAQILKKLTDKIDEGEYTEQGLLDYAANMLVAPKKKRVGGLFSEFESDEAFERRTAPEKRKPSPEEQFNIDMLERYRQFKGSDPVSVQETESGETVFFDGTYWYKYDRRQWWVFDGKEMRWITVK